MISDLSNASLLASSKGEPSRSDTLTEKRSFLEELARRLLEKEVVEQDELKALLAGAGA